MPMRSLAFRGLMLPRLGAMLGPSFTSNVPVILTRATEAFSQDLSGNLYRFGVDVPRETNRGRSIAGAATRQHPPAPTNGNNVGATSSTLSAEGLFNPVRVISAGAAFHRRDANQLALTSGTPVYIRLRVRAGTSDQMRIVLRDNVNATESRLDGAVESPAVSLSLAGTITNIVNRLLPNGDREFTFTWTPNATVADGRIGIGPFSAVTGQYIDVLAMQATTAFSDHIMGGAGTKAVAADIMSLNLTGLDMSAGFMLRMDGVADATPRVAFDQPYTFDDGGIVNRGISVIALSNGAWGVQQFAASVSQGFVSLRPAITPPVAFSLIGAHGVNYIGGAYNGVVAAPDTVASYNTPTRALIGSVLGSNPTALTLTAIRLIPGAPTTPKVTELAA